MPSSALGIYVFPYTPQSGGIGPVKADAAFALATFFLSTAAFFVELLLASSPPGAERLPCAARGDKGDKRQWPPGQGACWRVLKLFLYLPLALLSLVNTATLFCAALWTAALLLQLVALLAPDTSARDAAAQKLWVPFGALCSAAADRCSGGGRAKRTADGEAAAAPFLAPQRSVGWGGAPCGWSHSIQR